MQSVMNCVKLCDTRDTMAGFRREENRNQNKYEHIYYNTDNINNV